MTTPFIKTFSPEDWKLDQNPLSWVKVGSSGRVGGEDWRQFRKSAGERLADIVKQALARWQPGEELIAVNAMGATEIEGPNRNFDGFTLNTLERYHPTFLTARWYRDHHTDDPHNSYGVIKAASFYRDSGRVPLIVALNATKEAAERNNGKIANLELDDLNRNIPIKVSMSCRVPEDVCVGCGNRAKSRDEYCKEASCSYGGCAENLGRVAEDGLILHVDNPEPTFFDLSRISTNQAGRTAYVYGRVKTASEFLTLPMVTGYTWVPDMVRRLAHLETKLAMRKSASLITAAASRTSKAPKADAVVALIERPGLLPPREWEVAFDRELPNVAGLYTKLASAEKLMESIPVIDDSTDFSTESIHWAASASLVPYSRRERVKAAAVCSILDSRRAATVRSNQLSESAIEYAAYQLASLHRHRNIDEAAETVILENIGAFS